MKSHKTPPVGQDAGRDRKATALALTSGLVALISFGLAPRSSLAAGPPYTFKVITTIGSAAPGGGAFVSDFEPTGLNNHGQLAFTAEPNVPGEEAIFMAGSGSIQQVMRFGQSAPGGGNFSVFELGIVGLNDFGDAAFAFTLVPPGGNPGDTDFGPPIYGGLYRRAPLTPSLSPVWGPNWTPSPSWGGVVGIRFQGNPNNPRNPAF